MVFPFISTVMRSYVSGMARNKTKDASARHQEPQMSVCGQGKNDQTPEQGFSLASSCLPEGSAVAVLRQKGDSERRSEMGGFRFRMIHI